MHELVTQFNVYVHVSKNRCYTLATINILVSDCMKQFETIDDEEYSFTFFFVDSLQELINAMREYEYSDSLIKEILLDSFRLREMTLRTCDNVRVYVLIEQN